MHLLLIIIFITKNLSSSTSANTNDLTFPQTERNAMEQLAAWREKRTAKIAAQITELRTKAEAEIADTKWLVVVDRSTTNTEAEITPYIAERIKELSQVMIATWRSKKEAFRAREEIEAIQSWREARIAFTTTQEIEAIEELRAERAAFEVTSEIETIAALKEEAKWLILEGVRKNNLALTIKYLKDWQNKREEEIAKQLSETEAQLAKETEEKEMLEIAELFKNQQS